MLEFIRGEPAIITGAAAALIALAVAFGLELTADQVGALMAVVSIVASVVTRQLVTPTSKLP